MIFLKNIYNELNFLRTKNTAQKKGEKDRDERGLKHNTSGLNCNLEITEVQSTNIHIYIKQITSAEKPCLAHVYQLIY